MGMSSNTETADNEKKGLTSTKIEVSEQVQNDKKDEAPKESITSSVAETNKVEEKGNEGTEKPKKRKDDGVNGEERKVEEES